jgi:hypothetical protein
MYSFKFYIFGNFERYQLFKIENGEQKIAFVWESPLGEAFCDFVNSFEYIVPYYEKHLIYNRNKDDFKNLQAFLEKCGEVDDIHNPMVLALYKILDDEKADLSNYISDITKAKELISELLPLIHDLDENNIDKLAEIIESNKLNVPFTIEEIDRRFYNFMATLNFIKENPSHNISFSPLQLNSILLNNQSYVERAFIDVYKPNNLHELIYIILVHILNSDLSIEKCKLCGKYFVNYGNSDYIYCNRIYDNGDNTCRQIGSYLVFKQNRKADPIGREYDKAYKKYYSRKMRGKMSDEDFKAWSIKASQAFAAYKDGKYSGEDFVHWLKTGEDYKKK